MRLLLLTHVACVKSIFKSQRNSSTCLLRIQIVYSIICGCWCCSQKKEKLLASTVGRNNSCTLPPERLQSERSNNWSTGHAVIFFWRDGKKRNNSSIRLTQLSACVTPTVVNNDHSLSFAIFVSPCYTWGNKVKTMTITEEKEGRERRDESYFYCKWSLG